MPDIDIMTEAEGWSALPELEALAVRAAEAALAGAALPLRPEAGLSLLFTGDGRMRELNRSWRGKDKATNVLSFPAVPPARLAAAPFLGDIALGYETVSREAAEQGKPLAHHVTHLVAHGVLHLLGFDHETEEEAARMEGLERDILAGLGVPDPYGEDA